MYTFLNGLLRFIRDKRGNIAPIFAFSMVPIIGFVGSTLDYTRGSAVKSSLQASLDATTLMLSREAQKLGDEAKVKSVGEAYFRAQFSHVQPAAKIASVDTKFETPQQGSFQLVMTASATVDLTFMSLVQKWMSGNTTGTLDVSAASEVKWGMKRLELSLVLDNTGSMAQSSKMTHLKTASKNLLTTLKTAAKKAGDIKVAIIPFDVTVKIGNGFKDEWWIDYDQNDISKNGWEGCVEDRDRNPGSVNHDVKDTAPIQGNSATYFPAVQCGSLATAMPLTDIMDPTGWTNLNGKIDQMTPAGNTNTTIGLVWGWHALTPNSPFTQGSVPSPDLDKVIIMLTDGQNTQNRWSTSQTAIDDRMKMACDNVKAANIRLYTVRVVAGNASLLRDCATNSTMYFDVDQASELNSVFSAIAQNLANLRISK
jgi:Flp pilus assembly protein TadG